VPGKQLPGYVREKVNDELLRVLEKFFADDSCAFADLTLIAPQGHSVTIVVTTEPLSDRSRTLAHETEELSDPDPQFKGGPIRPQ